MTMKIERISDNQIRCTLNKADLAGKETLLNELAFGSDKAKGLFRELMKKASQTEFSISSTMLLTAICPNWLMQCIWPLWIPTVTYTAFLPWKK